MVTAYSYVRFSTPDQLLGDSKRRQLQMAMDYCRRHGLTLSDRSFEDLGISGFSGKSRPSLEELLQCIDNGVIKKGDYILIETFDRLSRQGIDATQQLLRKILLAGVIVVSLQDDLTLTESSLNESTAIIRVAIRADLAHSESVSKSKRLRAARAAQRERAAAGEPCLISSNLPFWLYLSENKQIAVDEDKASLVNRIFDLSKQGHGFMSIINILNGEEIPAPKAKIWAKSSISKLLSNRSVLGEYQPYVTRNNKREVDTKTGVIPNYFPQIVTDEKFAAVQVAKQQRKTYQAGNRRKNEGFSNLFQRFAKCGQCGSTMEFVNKGEGPKGGQYLTCSVAKRGGKCTQKKNFKYQVLESALYALAIGEHINFERDSSKNRVEELSKSEYELLKKRDNFSSYLNSGLDFSMPEVRELAKKQENEIKELEVKVREMQWEVNNYELNDAEHLAKNLNQLRDNTKSNFNLRAKFNLELIRKYEKCTIREVKGYIRINFGELGPVFISRDHKWLLLCFTGYVPTPLITAKSGFSIRIDKAEMAQQAIEFFDTMVQAVPSQSNELKAIKANALKEIARFSKCGVV